MPFQNPDDHYVDTVPAWGRQATAELNEMLMPPRPAERAFSLITSEDIEAAAADYEAEQSIVWTLLGWIVALTALATALTILAVDIRVVLWVWHP